MGCTPSSSSSKLNSPVESTAIRDKPQSPKAQSAKPQSPKAQVVKSNSKSSLQDENDEEEIIPVKRTAETNLGVLMAVSRLQRKARRMKALKVAQKEQQWKLFADLDTQDEAEMLHLAVFMQTLIDSVPNPIKLSSQIKNALDDEEDFEAIPLGSIKLAEKRPSFLKLEHSPEYDIEANKIDSRVCEEIVETYRKGGKLSRKSVVKILRRAYKLMQKLPNVSYMDVPDGSKLTVVGDLHGQLSDLLHILDEAGLPSATNKFIFNGDFVDRGEFGVEIVVILMALFVAEGPNVVSLNRGNHEDLPVCRVYGFENEVKAKYDELLFEMFAEVFNFIPLFAVANNSVFVVHGGLFHTPNVALDELNEIVRSDYYVKPAVPYPQNIRGLAPDEARKEFMKQLQRDALWSDPTDEIGCYLNPRGAGVSFGPDIASAFMKKNHLDMVVRSHECVYSGFDLPYSATENNIAPNMGSFFHHAPSMQKLPDTPLLCTLFSASNYIGGDNQGAVLVFLNHKFTNSTPVGGKSSLHYSVHHYKTSAADHSEIDSNNHMSLRDLILKRKSALNSAFEVMDTSNSGLVSRLEWADIMQRITMIKIRWLSIIDTIAVPTCLTVPNQVNYRIFLSSFTLSGLNPPGGPTTIIPGLGDLPPPPGGSDNGSEGPPRSEAHMSCMDEIYGQRRKLETVFYFFDSNGDGVCADI
jgi:hypothetical protein